MTKQRTKRILAGVLAMTLAAAAPCTAYAGYWQYDGAGWWYERDDGSNPAGQWEQIDGIWYYFYRNGYMAADTQTPDGSYVDESGAWIPGYSSSRLTAQEVANILYSTNEPVGSYGIISMEIGQFSDDGTIYARFTTETMNFCGMEAMPEKEAMGRMALRFSSNSSETRVPSWK